MIWCNNGKDLEHARKEIKECKTIEGLRHIYAKYPNYQTAIKQEIIERKALIEDVNLEVLPNSEIVEQQNQNQNGTT
jgi:hypothetical protein